MLLALSQLAACRRPTVTETADTAVDTGETLDTSDTAEDPADFNFDRAWDAGGSGCDWAWIYGEADDRDAGFILWVDLAEVDQAAEQDFHVERPLAGTEYFQVALPGGSSYLEVRDCEDSGFVIDGRVWTATSANVVIDATFSDEQKAGVYAYCDPPLAIYAANVTLTDLVFTSDDGLTTTLDQFGPFAVPMLGWSWTCL